MRARRQWDSQLHLALMTSARIEVKMVVQGQTITVPDHEELGRSVDKFWVGQIFFRKLYLA